MEVITLFAIKMQIFTSLEMPLITIEKQLTFTE